MGASALKQLDMGDNGQERSQTVEVSSERLLFGENMCCDAQTRDNVWR